MGLRAEALASDLGLNPGSAAVRSGCRGGVRLHSRGHGHCRVRAKGSPLILTAATGSSCGSE